MKYAKVITIFSVVTTTFVNASLPAYADIGAGVSQKIVEQSMKREENTTSTMKPFVLGDQLNVENRIFQLPQFGDLNAHSQKNLQFNYSTNLIPTGYYGVPGEQISVYVEADGSGMLPSISFTQQEGAWNNWIRTYKLKPGLNTFIVPTIYNDSWSVKAKKGGAIYFSNPYTAQQQGMAPKVRLEGGTPFPLFKAGDNEEQFLSFLANYKKELEKDASKLDIFEIVSEHTMLTGTATGAYEAYVQGKTKPSDTLQTWDSTMNAIYENYGLDNSSILHDKTNLREPIRLMQPYAYMYAAGDHIGVQRGVMTMMLIPEKFKASPWGFVHETGHTLDMSVRLWGETTNNMVSQHINTLYNGPAGDRVTYGSEIYPNVAPDDRTGKGFNDIGVFGKLGMFWQLQLFNKDYWPTLQRMYRERKPNVPNQAVKQDVLVQYSSEILKMNLAPYFDRYKFAFSDETRNQISKYPPLTHKIWYLNGSVLNYKGNGLATDAKTTIESIKLSADKTKAVLSFSINDKENVLGYEVKRNGKVIGFITNTTYEDTIMADSQNYTYTITPYGKDLRKGKEVEQKLHAPSLSIEDAVTVKLGDTFNPMDYAKALDWMKKDITSDIKITKNNVNTAEKGAYTVQYDITNEGSTVTKETTVYVVSDYVYASEMKPTSSKVGYGKFGIDKNPAGGVIKLNRQGITTTYKKGLGTHAPAEVVYNVEGKGFDTFESYIGVEQTVGTLASVTFEVWIDGRKTFNSHVYKLDTKQSFIKVPITGAKEVKLVVTDGGNGNGSDHANWADAKFTKNESKPVLTIPKSISTKVGNTIDIAAGYKATDIEDGDLTSAVKWSGDVDFNKPGEYPLTYSVTDSAGNTVTETRTVAVVDMNHYTYVTDIEWQSAKASYSTVKKDKAVSGNTLRLTDKDGKEVMYQRGIGAHSTSTIIYNITDKSYNYFSTYVGVDRQMYNTVGSVTFQIWLDGVKAYDSGLMKSKDPQKYIEVDINGVKEVKLVVTDGGNGNGSDHATFGDAKFY